MTRIEVLFTDLDGTCIHWPENLGQAAAPNPDGTFQLRSTKNGREDATIIKLPPSTSGSQGVISVRTLQLYAALRALGVKLVIVTGARMSTVMQRLPYLPAADAIVCETGGRIFYPNGSLPTVAPLLEDLAWRHRHDDTAGPAGQDGLAPELRQGSLWRLYAAVQAGQVPGMEGVKLDSLSYTTAFRVRLKEAGQAEALRKAAPAGLASAVNLGHADVFPATSGKERAAEYLMQRFGAKPSGCVFMCDDDNDMELAHLVRRAYLPGITADSVAAAVAARPAQFYVAGAGEVWGTEEILELLIEEHLGKA